MSGSADVAPATVRLAARADAEGIATVHVASWRAAYRGVVPARILDGLSVERRAAMWRTTIEGPGDERVWVVERDAAIAGFAATGPARDEDAAPGSGELNAIYLDPAAWSQGLGRRLFAVAVDDLRARGFRPLLLWVLTLNPRGRRFYEAAGWQPDGMARMLDFDGTPIEEIRYVAGS